MKEHDLLKYICERLCTASGTTVFTHDEIKDWPIDFVTLLTENKWLRPANYAKIIECTGCEENCFMPVYIFPKEAERSARAFISCDKPQEMGRIAVDMQRLQQWQFTLTTLAEWLAITLKLSVNNVKAVNSKEYQIGILHTSRKKSLITLRIDTILKLAIAGHFIDLLDVLELKRGKLNLNRVKLLALIESPAAKAETPEERQKRLRNRRSEEKAKGTKSFLKIIAAEEGISISRLKQILSKQQKSKDQDKRNSLIDSL